MDRSVSNFTEPTPEKDVVIEWLNPVDWLMKTGHTPVNLCDRDPQTIAHDSFIGYLCGIVDMAVMHYGQDNVILCMDYEERWVIPLQAVEHSLIERAFAGGPLIHRVLTSGDNVYQRIDIEVHGFSLSTAYVRSRRAHVGGTGL